MNSSWGHGFFVKYLGKADRWPSSVALQQISPAHLRTVVLKYGPFSVLQSWRGIRLKYSAVLLLSKFLHCMSEFSGQLFATFRWGICRHTSKFLLLDVSLKVNTASSENIGSCAKYGFRLTWWDRIFSWRSRMTVVLARVFAARYR
jgi:hypothetical protein